MKKNNWKEIPSLNFPDSSISSAQFDKKYIFTFGGSKNSKFEKLNILIVGKWEIIDVHFDLYTKSRRDGNAIQISNSSFLIFGGYDSTPLNLIYFNKNTHKYFSCKNIFFKYSCSCSKPIFENHNIFIMGAYSNYYIVSIDIRSNKIEQIKIPH